MKRFSFTGLALWVLCGAILALLMPGPAVAGWVSQSSGTAQWLMSVNFPIDASTGFVVGGGGTI
jgi:hypothetical protein